MERVLKLAGKNSGEIYQLRYPQSLLNFCDYDLSYFAENAIAVCDEALRSGEIDIDRVTELRNSLRGMHVYIEHNLRTVYEKIVLDCWIDYVCRRDSIGTTALWNRFMNCRSPFEKSVFVRLCEYRYNKGINEWLNLVRVQDYAKSKVYFLFSRGVSGVEEANARRNYFDLMFSVTARELGCRLEDLGVIQVYSAGRLPSAPFMYPNISKDIMRNVLADFDYTDDYSDIASYECLSDQIAMDAFARMKQGLAQEMDSYNMSREVMENAPEKVYMPMGLKAAVDLEIDSLLDSGGWLARCKRCGRYFVMDGDHPEEYCQLPTPNGKTCLDIYREEHPEAKLTPELIKRCDVIANEMFSRISEGKMTLKEYEDWKHYLDAMKEKVSKGEIQPDDLSAFIEYSGTMDISQSRPVSEVRRPAAERSVERIGDRVVRPFVPERISRSDIQVPPKQAPARPAEAERIPEPAAPRERPASQPQNRSTYEQAADRLNIPRQPMSHIIRGGEVRGTGQPAPQGGFAPFSGSDFRNSAPQAPVSAAPEKKPAAGQFAPFGGDSGEAPQRSAAPEKKPVAAGQFAPFGGNAGEAPQRSAAPEKKPVAAGQFAPFGGNAGEAPQRSAAPEKKPVAAGQFAPFGGNAGEAPQRSAAPEKKPVAAGQFAPFGGNAGEAPQRSAAPEKKPVAAGRFAPFDGNAGETQQEGTASEKKPEKTPAPEKPEHKPARRKSAHKEPAKQEAQPEAPSQESAQRPKVIRRNAAAISAYGKMAGAAVSQNPDGAFEVVSRPQAEQPPQPEPAKQPEPEVHEEDPFWNVGSIFDVLQQSEAGESKPRSRKRTAEPAPPAAHAEAAGETPEPAEKPRRTAPIELPEEIPAGIWTEERELFSAEDSATHEEIAMLKEKKRGKSNKTQRLFDAIMRESDDNPNFRKK